MDDLFKARAKGGIARREALSDEARKAIAKKAATARWGARATHKGNFLEEFGIDVDCYVLDDDQKSAVISQRGMGAALGLGVGGSRLPMFVNSKRMAPYVGQELREKLENPLIFQASSAGGNSPPPSKVNGYDVTVLIDICKAVVSAEGDGQRVNPAVVRQAHVVLTASAKAGIKGLVYALAGYSPSTQEVIEAFKLYVMEEAKKYEPEFPNELYMQWHRLYELAVPERGRPWQFKFLTVNHVYYPIANSNGKLLILLRALKANGGDRAKKLFQFLNDIGARALRIQLGRVLEMAESSPDRATYERKIVERFGGQKSFEFPVPNPSTALPPPSSQSPNAAS